MSVARDSSPPQARSPACARPDYKPPRAPVRRHGFYRHLTPSFASMLTADLAMSWQRGDRIKPRYVDPGDEEYLRAVRKVVKTAKISALLIPGIGTIEDLHMAADCGIATVR